MTTWYCAKCHHTEWNGDKCNWCHGTEKIQMGQVLSNEEVRIMASRELAMGNRRRESENLPTHGYVEKPRQPKKKPDQ